MQAVNIVFLLFPKVHLMDLSGAAQVFYEANNLGHVRFRLHYVSFESAIQSEQGLRFSNLLKPEAVHLRKKDLICIPGVDYKSFVQGEMDEAMDKAKHWLKSHYQQGVYLSSICSGALILAKLGILNGVKCTTHWNCLAYSIRKFPKAKFLKNRLYVFDKNIFTSAGMTSGIDMSLALIENWVNPLLAAKVAQEMVINVRRAETQNQQNTFLDFKNHFNEDVYKAQQLLAQRLESSFTAKDLAMELNISERQLARLFKSHTRHTIQAYRDKLRLEHGKQLLQHTELSIKEISAKCGYESSRQFIRLWTKHEGQSPSKSRLMVA